MITPEQMTHNSLVELELLKNNREYEEECREMEEKRKRFYEENPAFPYKNMFIMVKSKKQICAIRYV